MNAPASSAKLSLRRSVLKSLNAAAKRRGVAVQKLSAYHYRLRAPDGTMADYWPTTLRVLFHGAYFDGIDPVDAIATLCNPVPAITALSSETES